MAQVPDIRDLEDDDDVDREWMNANIIEFQRNSVPGLARVRGEFPYSVGEREVAMLPPPPTSDLHALVSSGGAPSWQVVRIPQIVAAATIRDLFNRMNDIDGTVGITTQIYREGSTSWPQLGLTSGNDNPTAIAATDRYIYVADSDDDKVFAYEIIGAWSSSARRNDENDFDLTDGDVQGMCFVNPVQGGLDNIYTVAGNRRVRGYQGAAGVSWLLAAANSDPRGIVFARDRFYVPDNAGNMVYRYSTTGTPDGSWPLNVLNADATGIAYDYNADQLLVTDAQDGTYYRYRRDGTYVKADTSPGTGVIGLTSYGPFVVWLEDSGGSEWYRGESLEGTLSFTRINGRWLARQ